MKALKFLGYGLAVLIVIVAVAATTAYFVSNSHISKTYTVAVRQVTIPTDAESISRGAHIARTRGCTDCHGPDLAGAKVVEDGAMGRVYGPNLTPGKGSRVAQFKDDDWVRAIRHGIGPDNRGLLLMPSDEYSHLSDEDLGAVIAYMTTLKPIDRDRVPIELGPVSRGLLATGKMKLAAATIDHANLKPISVVKSASADYGRYLANGCTGCHGPNFSGGKIAIGPPSWPSARNLTPHEVNGIAKWTEADFFRAMREAKRPDGTELNPVMPRTFGAMDDTELRALYTFFKTLPPAETGAR